MFVDVQSFLLDATIDAQTVQTLDAVEQDEAAQGCPEVDAKDAEALSTEESPAVTVEGTA